MPLHVVHHCGALPGSPKATVIMLQSENTVLLGFSLIAVQGLGFFSNLYYFFILQRHQKRNQPASGLPRKAGVSLHSIKPFMSMWGRALNPRVGCC